MKESSEEVKGLNEGYILLFYDIAAAIVQTIVWIVFSKPFKITKLNFHGLFISNIYVIDI